MRSTAVFGALLGLVTIASAVACSKADDQQQDVTPSADDGSNDIIGGVDAKSASLDAVGALVYRAAPGQPANQLLCSATLIGPRHVLTAKHCATQLSEAALADGGPSGQLVEQRFIDILPDLQFAIGSDIQAPKRLLALEAVDTCMEPQVGSDLGCDVAVYRLKEAVTDIQPLPVATASIGPDEVGKKMIAIGYGNQASTGPARNGTRKLGSITARAVTGAPMKSMFPTFEEFLNKMRTQEGEVLVNSNTSIYQEYYDRPLIDGYEAFFGGQDNDVQACHGDSGGPLLAKVDGKLIVKGVASRVVSGVRVACSVGTTYATFGANAQTLVKNQLNDPCEGIPAEGKCEGDVAIRCTNADEGERRVTKTDCSDVLLRCIPGSAAGGDAGAASVSCGE